MLETRRAGSADRRQRKRDRRKRRRQHRREPLRRARADDVIVERTDVVGRQLRIEDGDDAPHVAGERRRVAGRPHDVRHWVALYLTFGEVHLIERFEIFNRGEGTISRDRTAPARSWG